MKRVMVNGCFDILHPGHVHFLTAAKSFGDYLIVGLNNDLYYKKTLYHNFDERRSVLRALRTVDEVLGFSEDTATSLVGYVKPDVYVTSVEYPDSPEVQYCKLAGIEVYHLPRIPRHSTTNIKKAMLL